MFISINLVAEQISEIKAKQFAISFFKHNNTNKSAKELHFEISYTEYYNNTPLFYIFNRIKEKGFVIISANNAIEPIFAYSFTGHFNINNTPNKIKNMLNAYKAKQALAIENNIIPNKNIADKWQNIINPIKSTKQTNVVNPLLSTAWAETYPYNARCPGYMGGPGGHATINAAGVALGQIMKFYNYPTNGEGSESYYHFQFGVLSANFGASTYNWDEMPNTISESNSNSEVEEIIYHAALAMRTCFATPMEARTYFNSNLDQEYFGEPKYVLETYFKYSTDCEYKKRSNYNDNTWTDLLKEQLDLNLPVLLYGEAGLGGHYWVADGYDNTDKIHINFGYNGDYNGYYSVTDNKTGDYALINIYPQNYVPSDEPNANFSANLTSIAEGQSAIFTDNSNQGTATITSWEWTFTGGTPSSFNGVTPPAITYNNTGTYEVSLTVTNTHGSNTETKNGYITVLPMGDAFSLDFESCSNYSQLFAPWLNIDNDGEDTYGSSDCDFVGEESAFGFMAFNPSDAGFGLASSYSGDRCGMAICPKDGSEADNLLISDKVRLGVNAEFKFWVLTPKPGDWGNETFNVLISTSTSDMSSFTTLESDVDAPASWSEKAYDLSSYQGEDVYLAIQHISAGKFMFWIDNIEITGTITENNSIADNNILIYPNPTKDKLTITNVYNSKIEITDIRGTIISSEYTSSNFMKLNLSELEKGTYIVRIIKDNTVIIRKIILK